MTLLSFTFLECDSMRTPISPIAASTNTNTSLLTFPSNTTARKHHTSDSFFQLSLTEGNHSSLLHIPHRQRGRKSLQRPTPKFASTVCTTSAPPRYPPKYPPSRPQRRRSAQLRFLRMIANSSFPVHPSRALCPTLHRQGHTMPDFMKPLLLTIMTSISAVTPIGAHTLVR